jgi:hypothetical protein
MAALSASVLWCGVAGAVARNGSATNSSSELLAQEAREFGCSGCNIMELIIAGSYRMVTHARHFEAQVKELQWTREDFVSSRVEEFAARRWLMRMLKQEDHEVFSSLQEWRAAEQSRFKPGWQFSEAFDGRLLLLPFFHRAQSDDASDDDLTLLLQLDASRLNKLDQVVTSWGGLVGVVVLVYVAARLRLFGCTHKLCHTFTKGTLRTTTPQLSPSPPSCSPPTPSHPAPTSTSLEFHTLLSITQ